MKIAIADDEALFRKGLALIIEDFGGRVAFEAADGQELLDQLAAAASLPDVVLLDLNMPGINGIEAAKIILERYPDLKLIVLSSYYSNGFVLKMIELGAASYLAKDSSPTEMETAIREVIDKGFYYDQKVQEIIRDNMQHKTRPKLRNAFGVALSDREQEVLQLICEELNTAEIAEKLFISDRTVEGHRSSLLLKLGCRNTAGLVVVAMEQGLVELRRTGF